MNTELQYAKPQTVESSRAETGKPPTAGAVYALRVNVLETSDELLLYADLPGVKPEDVSLHCKGDELIVHARCSPRHRGKRPVYTEYGVGDYYRALRIAEQVETNKIEASVKDGVLSVRIPKADSVRPRRINVQGG